MRREVDKYNDIVRVEALMKIFWSFFFNKEVGRVEDRFDFSRVFLWII